MWDVGPMLLAKLGQRKGTDTFINVLQTHPVHPLPCQSSLHRARKEKAQSGRGMIQAEVDADLVRYSDRFPGRFQNTLDAFLRRKFFQ